LPGGAKAVASKIFGAGSGAAAPKVQAPKVAAGRR
jgi:hypothetical protein